MIASLYTCLCPINNSFLSDITNRFLLFLALSLLWVIVVTKDQLRGIAERLKNHRKELGLTQEEMAEKLEMTYSSYSKVENGFQQPGIDMLVRISGVLSLSLDYLVFGASNRKILCFSEDERESLRIVSDILNGLIKE